jgi:hypothetical protein
MMLEWESMNGWFLGPSASIAFHPYGFRWIYSWIVLRKLGAYPCQNALAMALWELGKLERTLFLTSEMSNCAGESTSG